LATLIVTSLVVAPVGCGHSKSTDADQAKKEQGSGTLKVETVEVVHPEKRDIRINVIQPGVIQSYEVTPLYSRLSGYVDRYRVNIGDRVKKDTVLIDMWIPDLVETYAQKTASAKRSEVQIPLTEAMLKAAEARYQTSIAALTSAEAGVRKSQANYDRWRSESGRIKALAARQVIDEQVRDETYRQFEESVAAREQAVAMVGEATASRDRAAADRDKARVDIEAARADLVVARAEERLAKVMVDFGQIKAPYDGVITQRNVNPGDYLQPGGGTQSPPLYVLEQVDPVRIFVGVPELFSGFIKDQDLATLRIQALPGRTIQGRVIRSAFSLNATNRTLQAEIDIPNPEGVLRPGMYVTVSIAIERPGVFTVPSTAVRFQGQQAYLYLAIDGKARRLDVQVGPSDDRYTEILRKHTPGTPDDRWAAIDGTEPALVGSMDAMADGQPVPSAKTR
jgi:HlyD family secretion protein